MPSAHPKTMSSLAELELRRLGRCDRLMPGLYAGGCLACPMHCLKGGAEAL